MIRGVSSRYGRQLGLRLLEVVGLHVGARRVVLERLDEDVLLWVLEVPRPVEPQVARLGAGRLGEGAGDRRARRRRARPGPGSGRR